MRRAGIAAAWVKGVDPQVSNRPFARRLSGEWSVRHVYGAELPGRDPPLVAPGRLDTSAVLN